MAILAGGSSLKREDVEHLEGRCRVIAINRAYQIAPFADWLYACDATKFWRWYPDALRFAGTKIVVRPCGDPSSMPARWSALSDLMAADVKILRHSSIEYPRPPQHEGISPDPRIVRGNNALFQILSIIAHTGAHTVLLLGADMKGPHWHTGYPEGGQPDFANAIIPPFATVVKPIEKAGVTVLNCSPGSAMPYWPGVNLRDVLP